MNYSDAIKYLKEHDIKKEDGTYYEFGEVHEMNIIINNSFCQRMQNVFYSSYRVGDCKPSLRVRPVYNILWEQGWCSVETGHLRPVLPGLESWTRHHVSQVCCWLVKISIESVNFFS